MRSGARLLLRCLAAGLLAACGGAASRDTGVQIDAEGAEPPAGAAATAAGADSGAASPAAAGGATGAGAGTGAAGAAAVDATAGPAFRAAIDPVTAAQLPHTWRSGCPVGPDRLRRVEVTHVGFDGLDHQGVLVVHADHAQAIVDVFSRLYAARFPIERMEPVDVYGGSDDASMAANNTSAFNCRAVTGGTGWSQHSYGWAIDVNPVQNPYVRGTTVLPPGGRTDRSPGPGVITAGDATVQAFAAIGWSWGGYWSSPIDYQHFSATNR